MRTVGTRARTWMVLVFLAIPIGFVLGRLRQAYDWNLLELYAGMAVAFTIAFTPALFWIEFAPDGAFGQHKRR